MPWEKQPSMRILLLSNKNYLLHVSSFSSIWDWEYIIDLSIGAILLLLTTFCFAGYPILVFTNRKTISTYGHENWKTESFFFLCNIKKMFTAFIYTPTSLSYIQHQIPLVFVKLKLTNLYALGTHISLLYSRGNKCW